MSDRTELFFKFAFLLSGLVLFVALVYSGGETGKDTEPVDPSPSPTQTPSQELTPKE